MYPLQSKTTIALNSSESSASYYFIVSGRISKGLINIKIVKLYKPVLRTY